MCFLFPVLISPCQEINSLLEITVVKGNYSFVRKKLDMVLYNYILIMVWHLLISASVPFYADYLVPMPMTDREYPDFLY